MRVKRRRFRSGAWPVIACSVIGLGIVGGLSAIVVLAGDIDRHRRGAADSGARLSEQSCLARNTVANMSGQMFLYVKELCRTAVADGDTSFAKCALANRDALQSDDGLALIHARCDALSGGSTAEP